MNQQTPSAIGFTLRHTPYGTSHAHEAIDAIMACSAYGHPITVFFLDDGVFCLLDDQDTKNIKLKSLAKQIQALPLYGVEQLLVCEESMAERGIKRDDLPPDTVTVSKPELQNLLQQQKHLLSF